MIVLVRLLLLFIMLGLAAVLVAALLPVLRSYLGGDDRRIHDSRTLPGRADPIERIEDRLDQLAAEQQHLAEQQQFITKLLEERAGTQRPPEP
ncbi:MAG: hypothetical protein IT360_20080 [Gemmatimonadaceae bacterium]|nr:hypothetical protein [Gemmatimonadaceae bacterium]